MAENEEVFLDEDEGIIELEDEEGNVTRFEFVDRRIQCSRRGVFTTLFGAPRA